jgi:hypothetical protein
MQDSTPIAGASDKLNEEAQATRAAVTALRRLRQPEPPVERCELCCAALGAEHRHLLAVATGQIVCACDPCALRFEAVVAGRFKMIPRDGKRLAGFQMSDADWESLALPINLVFIYQSSRANRVVAMYPSPAGATESLLTIGNWSALVVNNPPLRSMQADVEALLIHRVGAAREYFIAPIDRCYELVGLIRKHWRGLSGGSAVWQQIEHYFGALRQRCRTEGSELAEVRHA